MATVVTLPFTLADATGFKKIRKHSSLNDGSISFFDFSKNLTLNNQVSPLPGGSVLKNYISGASDAIVTGPQELNDYGLLYTADNTTAKEDIGQEFNFLPYDETSANKVISVWLISDGSDTGGLFNSVLGYAYQAGQYKQWYIAQKPDSNEYRINFNGVVIDTPITPQQPTLISIWVNKTVASIYVNGVKVQTGTIPLPIGDPTQGDSTQTPRIGQLGGFGNTWRGTVHSLHLFDGTELDVETELAEEYSRGQ